MKLELISFAICPFAQRGVITLKHKSIPFEMTFIDLGDPPDWFTKLSPFGKVPLLRVDDEHTIFESAVIDEFLDEITPGQLLPDDPLTRALDRSWIEFGSACLLDLSGMMHAKDAETFDNSREQLQKKLNLLEQNLRHQPYFNGPDLSLVDFAYAPLFMRCELLGIADTFYAPQQHPHISAWGRELLALPAVQDSVVKDFNDRLRNHIRNKAPYAAREFGLL